MVAVFTSCLSIHVVVMALRAIDIKLIDIMMIIILKIICVVLNDTITI